MIVFSAWRDDPVAGLIDAAHESTRQAWSGNGSSQNGAASRASRGAARTLTETLQACADFVDGDLVIILDQFEEYFLYHAQDDGGSTFAGEFARAVSSADVRASFLVAIREDALAKLDRFEGHIPNLFSNFLRIEHLDRPSARAAIERPIQRYNAVRGTHVSIEPGLVDAVLDQVRMGQVLLGDTGRGTVEERDTAPVDPLEERIETPYLQLVMTRLWQEDVAPGDPSGALARATLDRLGGAEQIVRTHLDATMSALPGRPARSRRARLPLPGHSIPARRSPTPRPTWPSTPECPKHSSRTCSRTCPDRMRACSCPSIRRLVEPEVVRYEIFHDVLGAPVLDWRSRYVQTQERAETERRLANERRRALRLLAGLVGVSVLLVVMIALAVFALQQRDAALTAERIASSRGVAATALAQQTTQPELSLLLAIEAGAWRGPARPRTPCGASCSTPVAPYWQATPERLPASPSVRPAASS